MFNDDKPEMLYHYCDANAAASIISKGVVWLSSFSLSNDTMEGHIGRLAISDVAELKGLVQEARDALDYKMAVFESIYGCYGMCFSKHSDMLSQWRGYADDGAGFAIGFRTDKSEWLTVDPGATGTPIIEDNVMQLHRVKYDDAGHRLSAEAIYDLMADHLDQLRPYSGKRLHDYLKADKLISSTLLMHWPDVYTMKGNAFEEESEWRAIAVARNHQIGYQFRATRGRVVPYIVHQLPQDRSANPIGEIVLGPKNATPDSVIEMMIESGCVDYSVKVKHSAASYR